MATRHAWCMTGAIYLHEGQSYVVDSLNLEECLANVRAVEVDYYTDVVAETEVTELAQHDQVTVSGAQAVHGELRVTQTVNGYRRVKRFTHETLGLFPLPTHHKLWRQAVIGAAFCRRPRPSWRNYRANGVIR